MPESIVQGPNEQGYNPDEDPSLDYGLKQERLDRLADQRVKLEGIESALQSQRRYLRELIQAASAAGASQRAIAKASGLSKTRVQRLCDLSKDGGNR